MGNLLMQQQQLEAERLRIADAVRAACVQTALEGYEHAGLSGLCGEGRWEMAVDSMRSLNLADVIHELGKYPDDASEVDRLAASDRPVQDASLSRR